MPKCFPISPNPEPKEKYTKKSLGLIKKSSRWILYCNIVKMWMYVCINNAVLVKSERLGYFLQPRWKHSCAYYTDISLFWGKNTRMFVPRFPGIPEMLYFLMPLASGNITSRGFPGLRRRDILHLRDSQELRDKCSGVFPQEAMKWLLCYILLVKMLEKSIRNSKGKATPVDPWDDMSNIGGYRQVPIISLHSVLSISKAGYIMFAVPAMSGNMWSENSSKYLTRFSMEWNFFKCNIMHCHSYTHKPFLSYPKFAVYGPDFQTQLLLHHQEIYCSVLYHCALLRPAENNTEVFPFSLTLHVVVNLQALLWRSQIFSVRSWLPETTLYASPKNLAAITLPLWPVNVCCNSWKIHLLKFIR